MTDSTTLQVGPFTVAIDSPIDAVHRNIDLHYAGHPPPRQTDFIDFHIAIRSPSLLRRWLRPQIVFSVDGEEPFNPLPRSQAYAQFEWGLNWCISVYMHRYLLIHSATLEKAGKLIVLPGTPGSGKSTLCAALSAHGWRLFSDEIALIDPQSLETFPLPRPINLKNESISVISRFAPGLQFGETVHDTTKGSVAHVSPTHESVARQHETARPAWIIFPKYTPGSSTEFDMTPPNQGLLDLAGNAFNYHVHGSQGFQCLRRLSEEATFARLRYSDLDDVVREIEQRVLVQ